jgi:hypothetical protein
VSCVLEESGAQVLPRINDQRQRVTSYAAHLCADADLRTTSPVYRDLAGRLSIRNDLGGTRASTEQGGAARDR